MTADRFGYDRMIKERGDPMPHIFLTVASAPNLPDPLLSFTKEMKEGAAMNSGCEKLAS